MSEFQTPVKSINRKTKTDQIVIPASPFLNRLGYGTGVNVMQLVRSPCAGQIRSPWALKMINKKIKKTQIFGKRLEREAEILKRMSHPNIVGFRAFSKTKVLYLGMESCDGSLGDLIEERAQEGLDPFTPVQMLKVARDISKGLDYIHTQVKILHGDIKSFNILVNGDFEICKLCDFGVTLPLDENGIFDKGNAKKDDLYYGTELWSAPEVLEQDGVISTKCDIFSFGLVIWEMMALMPPHSPLFDEDSKMEESVICLDDTSEQLASSECGTRPSIPVSIEEQHYEHPLALFYCCTERIPQMRPTAHHLALCAEDMLTKL